MSRALGLAGFNGSMGISAKVSRLSAIGLAALGHVVLIYLLVTLSGAIQPPREPQVEPFLVRLLSPPTPPPRLEPPLAELKPKLLKQQITWPEHPVDFQIDVPDDPPVTTMPDEPIVAGSTGPHGPVDATGHAPTISIVHIVEPIFPAAAARTGEHGVVSMAVLVDERGRTSKVKVLHSSGFWRLDDAAVHAVRRWTFTPAFNGARAEGVWTVTSIRFGAVHPWLLSVPMTVMPYDSTVDQQISAAMQARRQNNSGSPEGEASLRHLVDGMLAAFAQKARARSGPSADKVLPLEEQLVGRGPIQSVEFLGFAEHGLDSDEADSRTSKGPEGIVETHWEVYDVKQNLGSSVWLVVATNSGAIKRAQVVLRR